MTTPYEMNRRAFIKSTADATATAAAAPSARAQGAAGRRVPGTPYAIIDRGSAGSGDTIRNHLRQLFVPQMTAQHSTSDARF